MHFFFPGFLWGLLTLALPVIIHLFHMRRYVRVNFSNVQFLKDVQQRESSRRKLKQRLILLARLGAIAMLVFAFAKPYFQTANVDMFKRQDVSIFIDNSYSMETVNRDGSLLDGARRRAKLLVAAYGPNDRFQLLTQDFEGSHQRLLTRKEFLDEVEKVHISPQSRSLQQIIDRQKSLLDMNAGDLKSIFVLSDFQKNMATGKVTTTPSDIPVTLIKFNAASLPNLAIDTAWLASAVHSPGSSEKLVVVLHNYADEKAEKIPVKLLVNGVQKSLGSFTVLPRSKQTDTLTFSGLQAGWQNAEIQLQDNPVVFDNRFFMTFQVRQQMSVLMVSEGSPNKYLTAVFQSDPFFKPETVQFGNVDYARLASYPLIILTDIKSIPTGLAQQLSGYVKNGGTLAFFPGADGDLASYKAFLQPLGAAYPTALSEDMVRISAINLQNKVFKNIFAQAPQNPDMPFILRSYHLSRDSRAIEDPLFELPGKQPFLADYRSGKGLVYVSSVPLRDEYSNLQHHALFVPLMLKMALLSGHDQPLFYTIGLNESIETAPIQTSDKAMIKLTRPGTVIIPDVRQEEGSTQLYFSDQIHDPGNYDLVNRDSLVAKLAFNNSRSESDLSYLTESDLKTDLPGKKNQLLLADKSAPADAAKRISLGSELWKLCLMLTLIFLAVEMLLVKFFRPEENKDTSWSA